MSEIKHFNIRVYGLFINPSFEVLISDEYVLDRYMTKFPGGGLIPGEGPEDCLYREAKEEFGQEITILSHFYTTGFFQKALFYEDHQLISIYYLADFREPMRFRLSSRPFDFENEVNGSQSFRFAPIHSLTEKDLSFPIDKYVLFMLKEKYPQNKNIDS